MVMSSPVAGNASSGGFASTDEELLYYKSQYEHLESELQEFQASSRELEIELERDVEASEKRERQLKEKVETLAFEVNEWKTKCKQSKTEANHAQTALQKEITTLRDSNRTLQLKLRDIEVANDDYERQARNTTSSLEDLESKYNVSIERGVMIEEEIKLGEQEREGLRIDNQRLRDELSDLKIEAEIVQERLRLAESALEKHHISPIRASRLLIQDGLRPHSPASVVSTPMSSLSSPVDSCSAPERNTAGTPPSPPISNPASTNGIVIPKTPTAQKMQGTPTPSLHPPNPVASAGYSNWRPGASMSRHGRTFSGSTSSTVYSMSGNHSRGTASAIRRPSTSRASLTPTHNSNTNNHLATPASGLPRSGSLYQIRGLIGKMQRLEERVHNARLKLPATSTTPGTTVNPAIGTNVTIRSPRKRQSYGTSISGTSTPITHKAMDSLPNMSSSIGLGVSRSGGRAPTRDHSVASSSTTTTGLGTASRPASRTSGLSKSTMGAPPPYIRPGSQAGYNVSGRPNRSSASISSAAASVSGSQTRRPRSSVSGVIRPSLITTATESGLRSSNLSSPTAQFTPGHVYSRSVNLVPSPSSTTSSPLDEHPPSTPPSRRTTILDYDLSNRLSASTSVTPTTPGGGGRTGPGAMMMSKRPVLGSANNPLFAASTSARRKSSGLPVRRQSSAAYIPEFTSPTKGRVGTLPPIPPLPPHTDSMMSTFSAGSTPGRPSSRLAMSTARGRAPTMISSTSASVSVSSAVSSASASAAAAAIAIADAGFAVSDAGFDSGRDHGSGAVSPLTGGVELSPVGGSEMFGDIGETF